MNALLDKVLSWLETSHTLECDAQATATRAQGYTPTCKCDFWDRATRDFTLKIGACNT